MRDWEEGQGWGGKSGSNSFQKLESMGCAIFLFGKRVQSAPQQKESNVIYDIYSCLILTQNHKNKMFVS